MYTYIMNNFKISKRELINAEKVSFGEIVYYNVTI